MTSCFVIRADVCGIRLLHRFTCGTMQIMTDEYQPRIVPILLFAAVVTFLVTVLRVVGESQGWDSAWFNPAAGSAFNPLGIVWLVPLFGFIFGRRLAQTGSVPTFITGFFVPMFGFFSIIGMAMFLGSSFEGEEMKDAATYLFGAASLLSLLALFAWPRAFFTLLLYGISARLPVMLVQYLDIQNGWQTHYGRTAPQMGHMGADERVWMLTQWQAGFWLPFTITLGCGFAAIGAAIGPRK